MKRASWLWGCAVVAVGLAISPGCGSDKPDLPQTYPASVKILYHDSPVEGANVTLVPQEQSGRGASGVTDASGVAKLGLAGLADGAVPGKYWVTVSKVDMQASDPNMSAEEFRKQQSAQSTGAPSGPKHLLPMKYLSAQSNGLECTVTEQPDQTFEFKLAD